VKWNEGVGQKRREKRQKVEKGKGKGCCFEREERMKPDVEAAELF